MSRWVTNSRTDSLKKSSKLGKDFFLTFTLRWKENFVQIQWRSFRLMVIKFLQRAQDFSKHPCLLHMYSFIYQGSVL